MPIERDLTPKPVLYLTDFALVAEQQSGNPYSEHSSRQLKQALHAASVKEHMVAGLEKLFGVEEANTIKHLDNKQFNDVYKGNLGSKFLPNPAILDDKSICFTYLSMPRPKEKDSDWTNSILSKKQLVGDQVPSYAEDFISKEMVQVSGYLQCTWLKDVWISPEIWQQLQDLFTQIRAVQPKLIILAGKWSLLFLATMLDGSDSQLTTVARTKTTFKRKLFFGDLNKYRASLLTTFSQLDLPKVVVLPILNPAFHWISPDKERIYQKDYLKVAGLFRKLTSGTTVEEVLTSKQTLIISETKEQALALLTELLEVLQSKPTKVAIDVETRSKTIDCIGFAYRDNEGFTIPFTYQYSYVNEVEETVWYKDRWEVVPAGQSITVDKNYWTLEEETEVLYALQKVMLHVNCLHVGQNYSYDVQWFYREWKLSITAKQDTMILSHVLFNYMPKDLGLLASLYIDDFSYWKGGLHGDNNTRWLYNISDCIYTLGIENILDSLLAKENLALQTFYRFQQDQVCKHITTLMNRGVAVDLTLKEQLRTEYIELHKHAKELLQWLTGDIEFNPDSTAQIKVLFKDICGITPVIDRKTKSETFGAKAMLVYLEEYPVWRTLLTTYLEYKRLGVFVRTFLSAKVSEDGKMRCSYNVAGTKTYRLASRKNIDGGGLNLQNLPSGARGGFKLNMVLQDYRNDETEDSLEDVVDEGFEVEILSNSELQANFGRVKDIFVPDSSDWIFFDADYSAIDLQFVVWESDCKFLKDIIKRGEDVYSMLAEQYYGYPVTKNSEARQVFKAVCHACVTAGHEVLTKEGWVTIETLEDKAIAVWDSATQETWFEVPSNMLKTVCNTSLVTFDGKNVLQEVTDNHRVPVITSQGLFKVKEALQVSKFDSVPCVGNYGGGSESVSETLVRFIVALQADGNIQHISKDGTASMMFGFTKQRKIDRFKDIIEALGVKYSVNVYGANKVTTFYIPTGQLKASLKQLTWDILNWDRTSLNTFLSELIFWDGNVSDGTRTRLFTSIAEVAEIWKTLFNLSGKMASIVESTTKEGKPFYTIGYNDRCKLANLKTGTIKISEANNVPVYCPTVSTSFFFIRKNGIVSITGNSNYLGLPPTIAATAGLSVPQVKRVQDFYFSKCPEIPAWWARIDNDVRTKGYTTNIFGARFWCVDLKDPMYMNKMVASPIQGAAGILVNKALCNLEENEQKRVNGIQVRLQVHDSIGGVIHREDTTAIARIKEYMEIVVPYKDPLIIPAAIKTSPISYGKCS